jgi:hypothetical protein
MHKILIAGLVAISGLAVPALAVSPAAAASAVPSCPGDPTITADEMTYIEQALRGDGYNVTSVEDWSGCVRAVVQSADGTTSYAYFDPDTLSLITTTAEALRG